MKKQKPFVLIDGKTGKQIAFGSRTDIEKQTKKVLSILDHSSLQQENLIIAKVNF